MLTPRADRRAFVDEILLDSWAPHSALRFEDELKTVERAVPGAQVALNTPRHQFIFLYFSC